MKHLLKVGPCDSNAMPKLARMVFVPRLMRDAGKARRLINVLNFTRHYHLVFLKYVSDIIRFIYSDPKDSEDHITRKDRMSRNYWKTKMLKYHPKH